MLLTSGVDMLRHRCDTTVAPATQSVRCVASRLARADRLLLLRRHIDDVRGDLFLEEILDAAHERAICVAVRSVDGRVRSGELEVEPALRLELLRGAAVVSPALTELEEALDC